MNVSLEYLERCSVESGFQVAALEMVVRLGELAGEVMRHPFLGRVLALKGGSALNLCFAPPQRLSVDLDFNYIGHVERQKMLEDRPRSSRFRQFSITRFRLVGAPGLFFDFEFDGNSVKRVIMGKDTPEELSLVPAGE